MSADTIVPIIAGIISTTIFAASTLPMLWKAGRTKDLRSYSLGNLLLANAGNAVHSVYVFHLPKGPGWVLHSFYLVSTALMLFWYLRHAPRRPGEQPRAPDHADRDGTGHSGTGPCPTREHLGGTL